MHVDSQVSTGLPDALLFLWHKHLLCSLVSWSHVFSINTSLMMIVFLLPSCWECLPPADTTSGSVGGYTLFTLQFPHLASVANFPCWGGRWEKLALASRRSKEEFPHLLVSKEDHFSCCDIRRPAWGLVWKEKHCLITSYRCRGSGVMSGCLPWLRPWKAHALHWKNMSSLTPWNIEILRIQKKKDWISFISSTGMKILLGWDGHKKNKHTSDPLSANTLLPVCYSEHQLSFHFHSNFAEWTIYRRWSLCVFYF